MKTETITLHAERFEDNVQSLLNYLTEGFNSYLLDVTLNERTEDMVEMEAVLSYLPDLN